MKLQPQVTVITPTWLHSKTQKNHESQAKAEVESGSELVNRFVF